MGAIAILMGLGISVFLLWFFESICNDFAADEIREPEHPVQYRNFRNDDARDTVLRKT